MTIGAVQLPCPKPADALCVLVHHNAAQPYLAELRQRHPLTRFVVLETYADLPEVLAREQPDAVLSFRMGALGPFPRETLLNAPSVKWLHATGAGIEHLPPWDPARIMVTNSSGLHTGIMAEYVAWAILDRTQRMPLYRQQQADRVWRLLPVDPLSAKTVLIVGMGRIGRAVADRLRAFGPRIIGVTRTGASLPEAERVLAEDRVDEALPEADIIVLLTPLTPATRGLFGRDRLLRCKPGAHVINVSRGPVLDGAATRELVLAGHLSAATLDVFDTEPLPPGDPIWTTPGIMVTPHVSGELADWQTHAAMLFSDNLAAWTAGRPLQNLCEPTRGY